MLTTSFSHCQKNESSFSISLSSPFNIKDGLVGLLTFCLLGGFGALCGSHWGFRPTKGASLACAQELSPALHWHSWLQWLLLSASVTLAAFWQ